MIVKVMEVNATGSSVVLCCGAWQLSVALERMWLNYML